MNVDIFQRFVRTPPEESRDKNAPNGMPSFVNRHPSINCMTARHCLRGSPLAPVHSQSPPFR